MGDQAICAAIQNRQLLQFYYTDKEPGTRVVEPYQLGYTKTGNPALSAYYLSGASESDTGPGWRLYKLSQMSQVVALPMQFSGPRPEYRPGTNKILRMIECEY